jgi:molecular chaperone Hsp33
MTDRIVTATTADGSISIAAGITTDVVREAVARHALAPTASAAVGRLITGAALLGASLKGHERLSLAIAGDGPLESLVADAMLLDDSTIGARAYAKNPAVDLPLNSRGKFDVGGAVGKGRLQVTKSYEIGQPYVGIVPLVTGEIGDDLASYLANSQQIPSVVALGVLANPAGIKAAGGAIAQVMPGATEATIAVLEETARLMEPITTQIEAGATPEQIAERIAGELDIRLRSSMGIAFHCRCTRDRVEIALLALGRDELQQIVDTEPYTEAVCEFCKHTYVLSREEVRGLIARLATEERSAP